MRTIYKYQISPIKGKQVFNIPQGAKMLSFKDVSGQIFFWAEVETEYPDQEIVLEVFVTGGEMSPCDSLFYIGTSVDIDGFVLHLYQHL